MSHIYLSRAECPICKDTAFVIDGEINCGCGYVIPNSKTSLELLYEEYRNKLKRGDKIKKADIIYKSYCKECKKRFFTQKEIKVFCDSTCRVQYWQKNNERSYKECLYCHTSFKLKRTKQVFCSKYCAVKGIDNLLNDYLSALPKLNMYFIILKEKEQGT